MRRHERRLAVIGAAMIVAAAVGAGHVHAQAAGAGGDADLPACDPSVAILATSDAAQSDGATASAPAMLDALVGEWSGTGTLFGNDALFAMSWAPTLDDRFLELGYEIEGPVSMKARAFYLLGTGDTLRGTWVDSRGEFLDLAATATDSSLAIEWSSPGETGRTIYRLLGPNTIEVCDFVRGDDGWRPFGAARYLRGEQGDVQ